jgi:hypothetical protein
VRSTGLGGAVHEVKRHSKVKVPKVSHSVRKVKRKWGSHKPKEIDLRPKKKVAQKKIAKPIKHEKMKVTVTKSKPKKEHGYKRNKYGDIYYE